MSLWCRLFGHKTVQGYWVETNHDVSLPTHMCERCDYWNVDVQRYIEWEKEDE